MGRMRWRERCLTISANYLTAATGLFSEEPLREGRTEVFRCRLSAVGFLDGQLLDFLDVAVELSRGRGGHDVGEPFRHKEPSCSSTASSR